MPAAKWKIPAISGLALHLSVDHEALEGFLKLEGYDRVIGHHFFRASNGTSTPVFAFDQLSPAPYPIAQVGRADGAEAPKTAYPGLQREGAVPWLRLVDTGSSVGGVNTVYRLETAGGKGPGNCQGRKGAFEVKYAAQCEQLPDTLTEQCANQKADCNARLGIRAWGPFRSARMKKTRGYSSCRVSIRLRMVQLRFL